MLKHYAACAIPGWIRRIFHLPLNRLSKDPLPPGTSHTQEHMEFMAPIVGDILPLHYEEAYTRAKLEQVLSKKAAAFKSSRVKRCPQQGQKGATPAKRPKGEWSAAIGQGPAGVHAHAETMVSPPVRARGLVRAKGRVKARDHRGTSLPRTLDSPALTPPALPHLFLVLQCYVQFVSISHCYGRIPFSHGGITNPRGHTSPIGV